MKVYEVRGNYEGTWETLFTATTMQEARQILEDYRQNEKNVFFSIKEAQE